MPDRIRHDATALIVPNRAHHEIADRPGSDLGERGARRGRSQEWKELPRQLHPDPEEPGGSIAHASASPMEREGDEDEADHQVGEFIAHVDGVGRRDDRENERIRYRIATAQHRQEAEDVGHADRLSVHLHLVGREHDLARAHRPHHDVAEQVVERDRDVGNHGPTSC